MVSRRGFQADFRRSICKRYSIRWSGRQPSYDPGLNGRDAALIGVEIEGERGGQRAKYVEGPAAKAHRLALISAPFAGSSRKGPNLSSSSAIAVAQDRQQIQNFSAPVPRTLSECLARVQIAASGWEAS